MKATEIFAKHISKSLDINIEFQEGATPCTNGSKIILPTELDESILYPMLGALIHESWHVRITDFNAIYGLSDPVRQVLNFLEDIRVDCQALKEYPNARALYVRLIRYAIEGKEDRFKNEPLPVKIMKSLYLRSIPMPLYDDIAEKVINAMNLEKYVTSSKDASATKDLVPIAIELYKLLYKLQNDINNGGDIPGLNKEDINKLKDEQVGYSKDVDNDIRDLSQELDKMSKEVTNKMNERMDIEKNIKNAKSRYSRNKSKMKASEALNDYNKADKYEQAMDEAEDVIDELTKELKNTDKEINKLNKANCKAWDSKYLSEKIKKLLELKENSVGLMANKNITLAGFDALNDVKEKRVFEISRSLDEILREWLEAKREEAINSKEGTKIDRRELPGIFTGKRDIFQEYESRNDESLLGIVIDASSSMGRKTSMSKAQVCIHALGTILKSLNKLIDDGLPIKTAVLSFNERNQVLKGFDDKLDIEKLIHDYYPSGSTYILQGLDKMKSLMQPQGKGKKLVIVLTDGEICDSEAKSLQLNPPTDYELVLVGIQVCTNKDIFKYNIKVLNDTVPIITKAILERL